MGVIGGETGTAGVKKEGESVYLDIPFVYLEIPLGIFGETAKIDYLEIPFAVFGGGSEEVEKGVRMAENRAKNGERYFQVMEGKQVTTR